MAWYIFDMDGTLLNDHHHIAEKTKKWLDKLKQQGHKLGVATGRPYEGIVKGLDDYFNRFDFIASYNGAMIDYQGINQKNVLSIAEIEKFKSEEYILSISIGNDLYTENKEKSYDIIDRLMPSNIYFLDKLRGDIFTIRITCLNSEKAKEAYNELIKRDLQKHYNMVMSTGIYILITHKNASKAHAVQFLHNKQRQEKIYFFGDSHNDLPVFDLAFITSIVPSNSVHEIKEKADYVLNTTNNETLEFNAKN